MPRHFNTSGPCDPEHHYMLPALRRLPEVDRLIERNKYFVVHAPRQVGKTTSLQTLARELTRAGRSTAVLVSMESGAAFSADVGAAEDAILDDWRDDMEAQLPPELRPPPFPSAKPGARIGAALAAWAAHSPRPLVVFLDEIDALRGAALDSVLRQLRSRYRRRPTHFPASLALIGLRDVRDYRVDDDRRGAGSPFNIVDRSLTLRNFTADEVAELYAQHTADTRQPFAPDAVLRAFELTRGQPWLVNALAALLVDELVPERSTPIDIAALDRARDILIERQATHLDNLAERLREPRVHAVVAPTLAGDAASDLPPDDIRYVTDLGLLRLGESGVLEAANPIYREVIVKTLAFTARVQLPTLQPTWLGPDGRLEPDRLLSAFLAFWRCHGEPMLRTTPYHEAAPHLVLLAFLDRVVNGGGRVEREYAIGSGRMDLCLRHGTTTLAIELKVWRDGRSDPLTAGLEQLDRYLAGLGLDRGWLILFDCRSDQPPLADRTSSSHGLTPSGRAVTVIRA